MLNNTNVFNKIKELKDELNDNIIIPVHHYQHPDIIKFADVIGDSYKLALSCAKSDKKFIIFCGVLFMAEGAVILAKKEQKVLIPHAEAYCPMADMVNAELAEKAYHKIKEEISDEIGIVLYINSYADMKNFCGKYNGSICTSSNASKIIKYFLNQNKRIFFLPDYNLGKNTALSIGIKENEIVKIKKDLTFECKDNIKNGLIFLWDGFCPVHQRFSPIDIISLKEKYNNIKIIVHPECTEEVVKLSDYTGSTEMIYKTIKESQPGSIWGVGTETTFVNRIAQENPDKTILPLKESKCINMIKNTPTHLLNSLISIKDFLINKNNKLKYEVIPPIEFIENAKKALNKMIEIVEN